MNYEDRTDLEAPASLLQPGTVTALRAALKGAGQAVAPAFDQAFQTLSPAAESVLTEVIRPHTELGSAPREAWPLGLAAARAGYRLGTAMLGAADETSVDENRVADLAGVVNRMHVYEIEEGMPEDVAKAIQPKLRRLLDEVGAPLRGDFEEHSTLSFCLGLAAAVVMRDRS